MGVAGAVMRFILNGRGAVDLANLRSLVRLFRSIKTSVKFRKFAAFALVTAAQQSSNFTSGESFDCAATTAATLTCLATNINLQMQREIRAADETVTSST